MYENEIRYTKQEHIHVYNYFRRILIAVLNSNQYLYQTQLKHV